MAAIARRCISSVSVTCVVAVLIGVSSPRASAQFVDGDTAATVLAQGQAVRRYPPAPDVLAREMLLRWNRIAVDASGLDHTQPAPGESRIPGEQVGPGRSSRAMAIVHIAMFEVVNAVEGHYVSYTGLPAARRALFLPVAIAQSAHDTLAALFPSQASLIAAQLSADLAMVPQGGARADAIVLGQRSAAAILAMREGDGSQQPEPLVGVDHITSSAPGRWRQDPVSHIPLALGARWGQVRPFVMRSGDQFRVPPPPTLTSAEYAVAFDEVKALGGDGVTTPTTRTEDEKKAGIYWAYDGTPSLCAPPRLYNQIAAHIAQQQSATLVELARLLALVNVAMADAGVAVWESKYFYDFWRPVTAIREADEGTGPTGGGDGNPLTVGDPLFSPMGAPASNANAVNFTPPFPAYPSGHAGFGGALFQTLRNFFGTDRVPFTFVSDEYNGVTRDAAGTIRPLAPRTFSSLSEAEEENGQSRVYLGIHWSFDKTQGINQGRSVADFVFANLYARRR
jgi:hypothetical protein